MRLFIVAAAAAVTDGRHGDFTPLLPPQRQLGCASGTGAYTWASCSGLRSRTVETARRPARGMTPASTTLPVCCVRPAGRSSSAVATATFRNVIAQLGPATRIKLSWPARTWTVCRTVRV